MRSFVRFLAPWLLIGCASGTSQPTLGEADLRVLFVGNSLTYANDMPGLVHTLAESAGFNMAYAVVASPNYSLEEHWYGGIAETIRALEADVVVLQQGPSSLLESQAHLRFWAGELAGPIREAGGVPALLMVWPDATRSHAFDAVRDSYLGAAQAVDGLFLPAGDVWRAAWARDETLSLYGPDGFHPSRAGSFAAALAVFVGIFDASEALAGCSLPSVPGVPPEVAELLCHATLDVWSGEGGAFERSSGAETVHGRTGR